MTGQEFRDYVVKKFMRTDKDAEIYQATTDIIADMRLNMRAEDFKEEAYIAGISTLGDYRISLPTDFGHLIGDISLTDTSDDSSLGDLDKISKQEYDEQYGARLLTDYTDGVPQDYCIYGGQMFLGPVPDSVDYRYQINYTTEAYTEVAAATDPVPFSDRYRNYLRAGVLMEMHDLLENYEESGYWRVKYAEGVSIIKKNDGDNIADNSGIMYSGV